MMMDIDFTYQKMVYILPIMFQLNILNLKDYDVKSTYVEWTKFIRICTDDRYKGNKWVKLHKYNEINYFFIIIYFSNIKHIFNKEISQFNIIIET